MSGESESSKFNLGFLFSNEALVTFFKKLPGSLECPSIVTSVPKHLKS